MVKYKIETLIICLILFFFSVNDCYSVSLKSQYNKLEKKIKSKRNYLNKIKKEKISKEKRRNANLILIRKIENKINHSIQNKTKRVNRIKQIKTNLNVLEKKIKTCKESLINSKKDKNDFLSFFSYFSKQAYRECLSSFSHPIYFLLNKKNPESIYIKAMLCNYTTKIQECILARDGYIKELAFQLQQYAKRKKELTQSLKDEQVYLENEIRNLKGRKRKLNILKNKNKKLNNRIFTLKKEIRVVNLEIRKLNRKLSIVSKKIKEEEMFKNKKGSFPWPVDGEVVTFFGKQKHASLSTYRISKCIEIKAEQFSNVKVIEKGKVVFKGPFKNYGKIVIVSHPGNYFTVYGHLARISIDKGDLVSAETIIGQCGIKPLYFEIRKGEKALDPLKWLKRQGRR